MKRRGKQSGGLSPAAALFSPPAGLPTPLLLLLSLLVLLLCVDVGISAGDTWIFEGDEQEQFHFAVYGSGVTATYVAGDAGFLYLQQVASPAGSKNVSGCLRNARFESAVSVAFMPVSGSILFNTSVADDGAEECALSPQCSTRRLKRNIMRNIRYFVPPFATVDNSIFVECHPSDTGLYTVPVNITLAGVYDIFIYVGGSTFNSDGNVTEYRARIVKTFRGQEWPSTPTMKVIPGLPTTEHTIIAGSSLCGVYAGVDASFSIYPRDRFGNLMSDLSTFNVHALLLPDDARVGEIQSNLRLLSGFSGIASVNESAIPTGVTSPVKAIGQQLKIEPRQQRYVVSFTRYYSGFYYLRVFLDWRYFDSDIADTPLLLPVYPTRHLLNGVFNHTSEGGNGTAALTVGEVYNISLTLHSVLLPPVYLAHDHQVVSGGSGGSGSEGGDSTVFASLFSTVSSLLTEGSIRQGVSACGPRRKIIVRGIGESDGGVFEQSYLSDVCSPPPSPHLSDPTLAEYAFHVKATMSGSYLVFFEVQDEVGEGYFEYSPHSISATAAASGSEYDYVYTDAFGSKVEVSRRSAAYAEYHRQHDSTASDYISLLQYYYPEGFGSLNVTNTSQLVLGQPDMEEREGQARPKLQRNRAIALSPYLVTFVHGDPHLPSFTVGGVGVSNAMVAEVAVFFIQARDVYSNRVYTCPTGYFAHLFGRDGPLQLINASVTACDGKGRTQLEYTASKAGYYVMEVTLEGVHLPGSPFEVAIVEQSESAGAGGILSSAVARDGWSYHIFDPSTTANGFLVVTDRRGGTGQPWTFVTNDTALPSTVSPQRYYDAYVRRVVQRDSGGENEAMLKDVSVFSATYCTACRVHIPPHIAVSNTSWKAAVYGFGAALPYRLRLVPYSVDTLSTRVAVDRVVQAGAWRYFSFSIDSEESKAGFSFQAWRSPTSGDADSYPSLVEFGAPGEHSVGQGLLWILLRKNRPPLDEDDASWISEKLMHTRCVKCTVKVPPVQDQSTTGVWYGGVFGYAGASSFTCRMVKNTYVVSAFGDTSVALGEAYPGSVSTFEFSVPPGYAGVGFQVFQQRLDMPVSVSVRRGSPPRYFNSDSSLPIPLCSNCRVHARTKRDIDGKWYISVQLKEHASEFLTPADLASLESQTAALPQSIQERSIGELGFTLKGFLYESCPSDCNGNGICIQRNIYICLCYPGYQGKDCSKPVGTKLPVWIPFYTDLSNIARVAITVEGVGDVSVSASLHTLELVDGYVKSEPPSKQSHCVHGYYPAETGDDTSICYDYDPHEAMTIMAFFKIGDRTPGSGSFASVGRPPVADDEWSFILYPDVVGDLTFVDFIVQDEKKEIYSARHGKIRRVGDEFTRLNEVAELPPQPPYLQLEEWNHFVGIHQSNRTSLYINGRKVAESKHDGGRLYPMHNATDEVGASLQVGHDARYPDLARKFFGEVKDVRILAYAVSEQEIMGAVDGSDIALVSLFGDSTELLAEYSRGSTRNPLPLGDLDDGSLPPEVFSHEGFCSNTRSPNENGVEVVPCTFDAAPPVWIPKRHAGEFREYEVKTDKVGYGFEAKILRVGQEELSVDLPNAMEVDLNDFENFQPRSLHYDD